MNKRQYVFSIVKSIIISCFIFLIAYIFLEDIMSSFLWKLIGFLLSFFGGVLSYNIMKSKIEHDNKK